MSLLIDIGNTRTKWALADNNGHLTEVNSILNADIAKSNLKKIAQNAHNATVANVAGTQMATKISQLLAPLPLHFIQASAHACGVENGYTNPEKLGADRWAALVAAWHAHGRASVVVNAGTAITIDAINDNGKFLGGSIMPGLRLMQASLAQRAVLLNAPEGMLVDFPQNTSDAMQTGCLNAAAGAIHLMLKRLAKHTNTAPMLVISGGDAHKLMQALNVSEKHGMITENLVLQGLMLLQKELR